MSYLRVCFLIFWGLISFAVPAQAVTAITFQTAAKSRDEVASAIGHRITELQIKHSLERNSDDRIRITVDQDSDVDLVKQLGRTTGTLNIFVALSSEQAAKSAHLSLKSDNSESLEVPTQPALTGNILRFAQAGTNPAPVLHLKLTEEAAKLFAQLSTENVGKKIVITLDKNVLFAGLVLTPIKGGNIEISRGWTEFQTKLAAAILSYGPLPASVDIIEIAKIHP